MELVHVGRDLYMRHTSDDGKSHVVEHRVWDADRFVISQQCAAEKVNAQQEPGAPRKAAVQQITKDQYLKERAK
jgi:hypothetical protein